MYIISYILLSFVYNQYMTTILCFSAKTAKARDFFTKHYGDDIVVLENEVQDYDTHESFATAEIVTCFTGSTFDAPTIDRFPCLKMIATQSTGFDHIDVVHAHEQGIVVSNVPSYGINTVAEHAFALILALSKKAYYSYEMVKQDMDFSRRGVSDIQGYDLAGKTIGIVGAGHIGRHAIKIAHGFGINIVVFDLHPDDALTDLYQVQWVDSMDVLYQTSDIVSFHVPYNSHTHHLFNVESLDHIKPTGMVVVNTARGEIIDTRALDMGLRSGKIIAAGLDVLEYESLLGMDELPAEQDTADAREITRINKTLVERDNVIVTPHNAFNTIEAIERIWQTTVDNISAFQNDDPINVVKKS